MYDLKKIFNRESRRLSSCRWLDTGIYDITTYGVLQSFNFYFLLLGLPTEAYKVVEEIHDDGTPTNKGGNLSRH